MFPVRFFVPFHLIQLLLFYEKRLHGKHLAFNQIEFSH